LADLDLLVENLDARSVTTTRKWDDVTTRVCHLLHTDDALRLARVRKHFIDRMTPEEVAALATAFEKIRLGLLEHQEQQQQ
jgi:hypothetical protein